MIKPKLGCPFCHADLEFEESCECVAEISYTYKCKECNTTVEHVMIK